MPILLTQPPDKAFLRKHVRVVAGRVRIERTIYRVALPPLQLYRATNTPVFMHYDGFDTRHFVPKWSRDLLLTQLKHRAVETLSCDPPPFATVTIKSLFQDVISYVARSDDVELVRAVVVLRMMHTDHAFEDMARALLKQNAHAFAVSKRLGRAT